jgi:hypothetical protein
MIEKWSEKTSRLVFSSEKKEELGEPQKTSGTMGRAIHSKGNKHVRGFSFVKSNWQRVAIFVECQ